MEDLREVGQRAIDSVNKLRTSDAGDLVLGIGEIIEELREEPELRLKYPIQYQNKLNHLEGLFREFAYGEGYELRNNRADILAEDIKDTVGQSFSLSGGSIVASGLVTSGSMAGLSGIFGGNLWTNSSSVAGIPPVTPHPDQDNEEDLTKVREIQEARRELEVDRILRETQAAPPKKFKKRWWKTKMKPKEKLMERNECDWNEEFK